MKEEQNKKFSGKMRFAKGWCVEEESKEDGKGKLVAYTFSSERRKDIIKDADIFKIHLCDYKI